MNVMPQSRDVGAVLECAPEDERACCPQTRVRRRLICRRRGKEASPVVRMKRGNRQGSGVVAGENNGEKCGAAVPLRAYARNFSSRARRHPRYAAIPR